VSVPGGGFGAIREWAGEILNRSAAMPRCEVCGNDYDKSFTVTVGGRNHVSDSFECAIHRLAPTCAHCKCRIIGHGVESDGTFFCCAHCAHESGVPGVEDRAS
jgi:hypothetical protein